MQHSDIYFYDFNEEFKILANSNIYYVFDEKGAFNSLDELFNEYERRLEVLKYFNSESRNYLPDTKYTDIGMIFKPELNIFKDY